MKIWKSARCAGMLLCLVSHSLFAVDFTSQDCFDCHEKLTDKALKSYVSEEGDPPPFPSERFTQSVHVDSDCIDCHTDITELDHTDQVLQPVNCGECHDDVQEIYSGSLHYEALQAGNKSAPSCVDCHGAHDIFEGQDVRSKTFHKNEPRMCASCHENSDITGGSDISMDHPFESYLMSVHGQAVLESHGNAKAAVCSDCHSAHNLRRRNDPEALLFKFNIPDTCGTCHEKEAKVYGESSHGKALRQGILEAPVCTDCHGEHNINHIHDEGSFTDHQQVGLETCARCHADSRFIQRFGFNDAQVSSYRNSYHGLAVRGGSAEAADCASCHGFHNIKGADDPTSTIHPENLSTTCGQCHPGVTDKVALGKIHVASNKDENQILRIIRLIYIPLILLVIGGMLVHNLLDFIRQERTHFKKSELTVQRFSLNQRIQHVFLFTSFIVLVVTGFALKFPDAWWVTPFNHFDISSELRGIIHRIAAVIMTALSVFHLIYLAATKEGRRDFQLMLMGPKDLRDMVTNFMYFIGVSKKHPEFGRFSYMEKAEYWALQWGTFIMCLTGFLLWFEGFALRYFPKWVTDAATLIHYFEAILATLAIIVWHFYYVIFNRHVYPLNRAMFVGRISEKHERLEHPLEKEELKKFEDAQE